MLYCGLLGTICDAVGYDLGTVPVAVGEYLGTIFVAIGNCNQTLASEIAEWETEINNTTEELSGTTLSDHAVYR